ncbi:unnamed protein product [Adineta steineri]|uniref:Uncharacterized protein n=1 Tax=Adineta steineri TaxID=433720 RepID=A0A814YGX4_9BILA|nr:unnamed protein product [Adineta steineri]CAF4044081.1 unnamed protein product [Adineta steineri]
MSNDNYDDAEIIQNKLYHDFNIEVPIKNIDGNLYARISAHIYNYIEQYEELVVESRIRRKRQVDLRSSAYYGLGAVSNVRYNLELFGPGSNLQPIGNNWYVPGMSPYPYNYPPNYNMQQYPYQTGYGYPNTFNAYGTGQYGNTGSLNRYGNNNDLAYIGQSYVPLNNEWLPLPGVNRRRRQ